MGEGKKERERERERERMKERDVVEVMSVHRVLSINIYEMLVH